MSITMLPTLYSKSRTGELRCWKIGTEGDKVHSFSGVVSTGVFVQHTSTSIPMNVGRSNETTGAAQAIKEAASAHKNKLDRKYSLTPEEAQEDLALPMLAKGIEKVINKKVTADSLFPADVQRKLDGVRAKARWVGNEIVLESRSGIAWTTVPHINRALECVIPKGDELDGEIYLHGKTLQQINSLVKKVHPGTKDLQYHCYDAPVVGGDDSLPWIERREQLFKLSIKHNTFPEIVWVKKHLTMNYAEAMKLHDQFVSEGYEGAIVRLLDGLYEFGYRSSSLLKIKLFQDAEFVIIGAKSENVERVNGSGETVSLKAVIWECRNDINDLTFETRPKGTHVDRARLFKQADKFIGQKLTVRFLNRTELGLPNLPIGHVIRLKEDLD